MTKDKKVLYIISLIVFAVLLTALFVDIGSSRIVTAIALLPLTFAVCVFIKKRSILSVNKREVLLLSTVIGVLYVVAMQLTGTFFEFYKNPYFGISWTLLKTALPVAVIIISTEIIRYVLLAQKNRFVDILAFLSCVIAEVLAFSNVAGITSFNLFMNMVGMTLFPAISANVLYHYVSKRYGALPNIAFRLITTLYIYFVPADTGMNDALKACIKIFLPLILLMLISAMYEKKKKNAIRRGSKLSAVATILAVVICLSVSMLISCQFRFGALVIATESMTGEINKGDMIVYERYDGQKIKVGQVIVFEKDRSLIVHRVMEIDNQHGELRYYTKGDANESMDAGFVTADDIVGTTDIKLPFVGYPTLWLRELISN